MAEELTEKNITCPYCKFEYGDSWEYHSDSDDCFECEECGKKFSWSRNTTVDYDCKPDCELNNEVHEYGEFDKARLSSDKTHYFRCRNCIKCDKFDFIKTNSEGNKVLDNKGDE